MLTRFWLWFLTMLGRDPRGLFSFYDGRRWRLADPLETLREFFLLPQDEFDWDTASDNLRQPFATVQVATSKRIAEAVRKVFRINGVDQGGLAESECLNLLNAFRGYIGDVKKNTSLYPILSDSTESNQLDDLEIPPDLPSASISIPSGKLPEGAGLPVAGTSSTIIP